MICSNWSTSVSAPSTFTVSWKSWPAGVGGMPIWPAATLAFCFWMALMTSLGVSERCAHQFRIQPDAHAVLADAEDRHVADPRQTGEPVVSWSVAKLPRNNASCALFVEVSVMIWRMAVDFFFVTTPCC